MSQSSSSSPRSSSAIVYGIVDLSLAALYLYLFLVLLPSRSGAFTASAVVFSGVVALGGVGMLIPRRWGRRVATISASLMLLTCLVLLGLLVASAAYLHGIYGGVGQAGVVLAFIAAALTVQFVGLAPALQLGYLWRTRHDA